MSPVIVRLSNPETFRLSPACELGLSALAGPERVLRKAGAEFAGAEGFEGAEAGGEYRGGETAFAKEAAEEVGSRLVGFAHVAFDTAGDEVAIGVAAEMHLRHDVIQALVALFQATQAVEAGVAFTGIDGVAQGRRGEEVEFVDCGRGGPQERRSFRQATEQRPIVRAAKPNTNLSGQEHFDEVAFEVAFDQAKRAALGKATHGRASRVTANTDTLGEPCLNEVDAMPAFEAGVTKEMGIDGAVDDVETELRYDNIIDLFPHLCRIRQFRFHDGSPVKRDSGDGDRRSWSGKARESSAEARWPGTALRGAGK